MPDDLVRTGWACSHDVTAVGRRSTDSCHQVVRSAVEGVAACGTVLAELFVGCVKLPAIAFCFAGCLVGKRGCTSNGSEIAEAVAPVATDRLSIATAKRIAVCTVGCSRRVVRMIGAAPKGVAAGIGSRANGHTATSLQTVGFGSVLRVGGCALCSHACAVGSACRPSAAVCLTP